MVKHQVTASYLAQETGIDRTVIYRYMKGKRLPADADVAEKIADALQMSEEEKRRFYQGYDKAVMGESMVFSYQYIQQILDDLENMDENALTDNTKWQTTIEMRMDKPMAELKSKEEIETCVHDLFRCVAGTNKVHEELWMIMQPEYDGIQRHIPQIFKGKDVTVKQLICMEQSREKDYKNLMIFAKIVNPCFQLENYEAYYYYDDLEGHINGMTFMPNILLARDYAVMFDFAMETGAIFRGGEFVRIVQDYVWRAFKESRSLLGKGQAPSMLERLLGSTRGVDMLGLSGQPCMGACIGRDVMENHIHMFEGRDEFIEAMSETYESVLPQMSVSTYASLKGLEEFMRSGCIYEFPSKLYSPLNMEEKRAILWRMIEVARSGIVKYRFISEAVKLPRHVQIYANLKEKKLIINKISGDDIWQLVINERSIYKTFFSYLEYLERKDMICDEKKSLEMMCGLYERYK